MHHPTDRITHTTAFVTPFMEHWLEREIAQWVHIINQIQKKENVLFNNTLNTFYSWLYGAAYMLKNHSDSKRVNQLATLSD